MCYEHQSIGVYAVIVTLLSRYYHVIITLLSRYYSLHKALLQIDHLYSFAPYYHRLILLQDAGVPRALISLTGCFHPLHPGVRTAWLHWGRGALVPKAISPPASPSKVPHEDVQGWDSEGVNFEVERDMNESLKQLRLHNGIPLSGAEVSRAIWSAEDSTLPIQKPAGPDSSPVKGLPAADVTVLIDRTGNLVLALKGRFDEECSVDGLITARQCTGENCYTPSYSSQYSQVAP